jgi:hypothetical protein
MYKLSDKPLELFIKGDLNYNNLKDDMNQIGVRNMFMKKKVEILNAKFNKLNIDCIFLKGVHLIHSIYPFGIRPLDDIDLLIREKDFEKVNIILNNLGYKDTATGISIWAHKKFSNKITYLNKEEKINIPIDIHFRLGPYPYLALIEPEILFKNSFKLKFENYSIKVLSSELLLIHIILHSFSHIDKGWEKSAKDFIAYFNNSNINKEKFIELVNKFKINLPVLHMMKIFKDNLNFSWQDFNIENLSVNASYFQKLIFKKSCTTKNDLDKYILQFISMPNLSYKLN